MSKEKAKISLEEIEQEKSTWKIEFIREMEIWEEIAMQINSYSADSAEGKHWRLVMDLYKEKYR